VPQFSLQSAAAVSFPGEPVGAARKESSHDVSTEHSVVRVAARRRVFALGV
jgi:hypothetical protein